MNTCHTCDHKANRQTDTLPPYCDYHSRDAVDEGRGCEQWEPSKAIIKEFERLGQKASYHYADDSTGEWRLGDQARREALALFDAHPALQPAMREVAKRFLWSLKTERAEGPEE